jgi:hypothetical protein
MDPGGPSCVVVHTIRRKTWNAISSFTGDRMADIAERGGSSMSR